MSDTTQPPVALRGNQLLDPDNLTELIKANLLTAEGTLHSWFVNALNPLIDTAIEKALGELSERPSTTHDIEGTPLTLEITKGNVLSHVNQNRAWRIDPHAPWQETDKMYDVFRYVVDYWINLNVNMHARMVQIDPRVRAEPDAATDDRRWDFYETRYGKAYCLYRNVNNLTAHSALTKLRNRLLHYSDVCELVGNVEWWLPVGAKRSVK